MAHEMTIREEVRAGMRAPEFRITCECSFEDKAQDENGAKRVKIKHLQDVRLGRV